MTEEKKLLYPEMEVGNYEAQAQAEIDEAQKRAEAQEKQAKWDRDMALIGDMAGIFSKGAAMHGGAWKINKDESHAAKGNEKLRALQRENAARLAEIAKAKVAARDKDRQERNAVKVAEYNAMVEQHKRDIEAQKYAKDFDEKKRYHDEMIAIQKEREDRLREQGGTGGSSNFIKLTMPDGTEKSFSKKELGDNWINNAYEAAVAAGMPRAMKYKTNLETGMPEPYEDTSLAGRKAHMEAWSAENEKKKAQPAAKPGSKGVIYTNDKKTKGAIY